MALRSTTRIAAEARVRYAEAEPSRRTCQLWCGSGASGGACLFSPRLPPRTPLRMGDTFRVRDISLKAEKKLLGKMSNKTIAKNFIDDTLCSVLDNLHALYKAYTGNRKEAEKLVKYIIKIVVKIHILYRNDQFTAEDLKVGNQLRNKFNTIVKTVISFFEVDFSFDKAFLIKNINECRDLLKQLVGNHLTDKSIARIDFVLDIFTDAALLEEVFRKDSPHRPTLQTIVEDMSKAFDEGGI